MAFEEFNDFADDARLWAYAFEKPLRGEDRRLVERRLSAFLHEWKSHHVDVRGAYSIAHDRFVFLAGSSAEGMSGCSIDNSVENFKYFRDEHGLDGLNRDLVFYRDDSGSIEALDRTSFQREIDTGRISRDTVVFDTTIERIGDLRAGRFEIPLSESWHARAFLPAH